VPRTIVTTGTSGGFGKLSVERFAAEGWDVVATVRKDTDPTAHLSKTGSVRYVTEQQGTLSALSGRFIDQAASTSTPIKIHSVDRLTVNSVTGEATYTGTYRCT